MIYYDKQIIDDSSVMATLNIEVPEELIKDIQNVAEQKNQTISETVIQLLNLALPNSQIKLSLSPIPDPTWEQRRLAIPKVLAEIEKRRKQRPVEINWPDRTALIREDRDR